ncbi:AMP-binding protein [Streptomyces sp. NPDC006326]|uniref:AMP-binding protein n=1 Tax=Streptomyces sp. NPDC006326 TaxID=3156752 RepID=UPI0033AEDEFA
MPSLRLLDTLADHVLHRPQSVALVQAGRGVTYRRLGELTEHLTDALTDLALPHDQPLCIPAHKTPETIALLIGAFRSGHSVLAPSPELGAEALDTLCAQARCSRILTVDENGLRAGAVAPDASAAEGFARVDPAEARLLLTTSGSTGTPKIVPVTAAAFDNFAQWAADCFHLTAADTALSYAPLNFDLSLLDVWTFLGLGARVVLVERSRSTDARHLRELVEEHEVTFVQGVPLLYRLLTGAEAGAGSDTGAGTAGAPGTVYGQARTVVFTGEAMPPELLRQTGKAFPSARFHNVFGCTETNDSFLHELDPATAGAGVPIGRPLPGVRALLLDDEGRVIEGPGTGELLVTTPFQTTGYLERARSQGVFVPAPDGGNEVFYRTGDVVTRDADGLHRLEGRTDFQVKIRGVRTNVQEVENVLAAHPDVAEAAVVALPDPEAGYRLHAQVTRRPGSGLGSLPLRSYSAKNLPRHAIPSSVAVGDTPLPRTSTGKPDRNLIKQNRLKGKAA